ncbi:MAG: exodeoxyribonuclease III [Anaerolineae bacterium]|nr:exodeoxyribonuclease III [Anaerolineae bacterium]NIN94308.1 exodeoxyribonuclease III [Anaerolineae bacterium]NIQ77371.1 exodeoxyribonuclease III [Anaerolineae bacterium]
MSPDTLKVATFNTNSIRARLELVLGWLQRETPDILCLQETKVQDAEFPADGFLDLGYYVVFRGQKAYAGVAIVSREAPQDVAFGLDDGEDPDEARLARARIGDVALVNTYVPQGRSPDSPHFQYKLRWLARLRAFFERHYSSRGALLWMGDFNVAPEPIDVYEPKSLERHVDFHPDARKALEDVRQWGFVDVFRLHHPEEPGHYTFWDYRVPNALKREMGWRVDHIWATDQLATKCAKAWIDVEARRAERPSDHTFVVAEFTL